MATKKKVDLESAAAMKAVEDALTLNLSEPENIDPFVDFEREIASAASDLRQSDLQENALRDGDQLETNLNNSNNNAPANASLSSNVDIQQPSFAANDDTKSTVADLAYGLNKKPSSLPFWFATIFSLCWLIGFYFYTQSTQPWMFENQLDILNKLQNTTTYIYLAGALLPIFMIYSFAFMLRHAQEMRYAAHSMTEAAIKLLQPENIASDAITSIGYAVRREVSAMGDGVEVAIAKATQLEKMVKSEVLNIERSYADSEIKITSLVGDLGHQRQSIIKHADELRSSIAETHSGLTQELNTASTNIRSTIEKSGLDVSNQLSAAQGGITSSFTEASTELMSVLTNAGIDFDSRLNTSRKDIENSISNSTNQLVDQINLAGSSAASLLDTQSANLLDQSNTITREIEDSIGIRVSEFSSRINETGNSLQSMLDQRLEKIDDSITVRGEAFVTALGQRTEALDTVLSQRTDGIGKTMAERLSTLSGSMSGHIDSVVDQLKERHDSLETSAKRVEDTVVTKADNIAAVLEINASEIDKKLEARTTQLQDTLSQKTEQLQTTLSQRSAELQNALSDRTAEMNSSLAERTVELQTTMVDRTADIQSAINIGTNDLQSTLVERTAEMNSALADRTNEMNSSLAQRTDAMQNTLSERTNEMQSALAERTDEMQTALADRTVDMKNTMVDRTAEIQSTLTKGTTELDAALSQRNETFINTYAAGETGIRAAMDESAQRLSENVEAGKQQIEIAIDRKTNELAQIIETSRIELADTVENKYGLFSTLLDEKRDAITLEFETQLNNTSTSIDEKAELISTILTERAKLINDTLGESLTSSQRILEQKTAEINELLQSRTGELTAVFDQQAAPLVGAIKNQGDETAAKLGVVHETVTNDVNELLIKLGTASESMGSLMSKATGDLDRMENSITAQANGMQDMISKAAIQVEDSTALAGQTFSVFDDKSGDLLANIGNIAERFDQQSSILQHASDILERSQNNFSTTLESRSETIDALSQGLAMRTSEIEKSMEDFSQMLSKTMDDAAQRSRLVGTNIAEEVKVAMDDTNARFSASSDAMRTAAAEVRRDLDETREQMRRGVMELPEETRQSADSMRKVVADQIAALRDLSEIVSKSGKALDTAQPVASRPMPIQQPVHQQAQQQAPQMFAQPQTYTNEPVQQFVAPQVTPRAPVAPVNPVNPVVQQRAAPTIRAPQQARAQQRTPRAPSAPIANTRRQPVQQASNSSGGWVSDLLKRADEPTHSQTPTPSPRSEAHMVDSLNSLSMDIARQIDHEASIELWERYQRGERNVFTRRLYTMQGQQTFEEIRSKYSREVDFKVAVDRYMQDFERLLEDVSKNDRDGTTTQTYLTSDTGKVYTMLAHASGRLS